MAKIIKAVDVRRDLAQLYLYIREALARGQTRDRIKRDLLTNGWLDTEVDKVFIRIDTEKLAELAEELEAHLSSVEVGSQDAYIVREMIERKKAKPKKRTKRKVKKKVVKKKVVKKERKHKFIGTKETMTYHRHDCKWVDNVKKGKGRKAYLLSKTDAHKKGYKQCKECIQ